MFPLPEYYLFPGAASPLRIFEPRYREMVTDLLDSPGRLVMACIDPAAPPRPNGEPAVAALGGLGEIVRHRPMPNGDYSLWVVGLGRVRIDEVDTEKPYRVTRVHRLDDLDSPVESASGSTASLRPALLAAIDSRIDDELDLEDESSVGLLADILAQCLPLPPALVRRCFQELDPVRRAELVLEEHRTRP